MANDVGLIEKLLIEIGFSDTKAIKGLKELDKTLDSLENKTRRVARGEERVERARQTSAKKTADAQERAFNQARRHYKQRMKMESDLQQKQLNKSQTADLSLSRTGRMIGKTGGIDPKLADDYKKVQRELRKLSQSAKTLKTDADFSQWSRDLKDVEEKARRVVDANRKIKKEFNAANYAARGLKDSVNNLARSYVSVFAAIGGGGAFLGSGMKLENAKISMITGTGSLKTAGEELGFVTEQAKKFGLSIPDTSKAYGKIFAGAKLANLTTAQTRELFEGLNEAAIAFSLTSEEKTGIFKAITDSFSKGTLMAEELDSIGSFH